MTTAIFLSFLTALFLLVAAIIQIVTSVLYAKERKSTVSGSVSGGNGISVEERDKNACSRDAVRDELLRGQLEIVKTGSENHRRELELLRDALGARLQGVESTVNRIEEILRSRGGRRR